MSFKFQFHTKICLKSKTLTFLLRISACMDRIRIVCRLFSCRIWTDTFTNCKILAIQRNDIVCSIAFKVTHSTEAVVQRCSVKNVFLKISQNSQGNTCKFSCEFSEIFQNTFFYSALRVATSELRTDEYRRFDCHSRPYLRVWQLDISAISCKIVTSLFRHITITKSN